VVCCLSTTQHMRGDVQLSSESKLTRDCFVTTCELKCWAGCNDLSTAARRSRPLNELAQAMSKYPCPRVRCNMPDINRAMPCNARPFLFVSCLLPPVGTLLLPQFLPTPLFACFSRSCAGGLCRAVRVTRSYACRLLCEAVAMTSFGKPKVGGKFYYGDPRDTPWNRDLLWVKFVNKEETDMSRPLAERAGHTGTQVAEVVRPKTKSRRGDSRASTAARAGTASRESTFRVILLASALVACMTRSTRLCGSAVCYVRDRLTNHPVLCVFALRCFLQSEQQMAR